jgi:hypothetical protein
MALASLPGKQLHVKKKTVELSKIFYGGVRLIKFFHINAYSVRARYRVSASYSAILFMLL